MISSFKSYPPWSHAMAIMGLLLLSLHINVKIPRPLTGVRLHTNILRAMNGQGINQMAVSGNCFERGLFLCIRKWNISKICFSYSRIQIVCYFVCHHLIDFLVRLK